MRVVVDTLPFTVEVRIFTAEFRSCWFMNSPVVVANTPLMSEVRVKELVVVEMVRVLLVMIEEVATNPFMLVVKVLPEDVCEKELISSTTSEVTPFTRVKNELVEVEIWFELIIVPVLTEPPTLEVRVFPSTEIVLEATRLEIVRLLIVAFSRTVVPVAVRLVVLRLASCAVCPVAVLNPRVSMYAVTAVRSCEKMFSEFTLFIVVEAILALVRSRLPRIVVVPARTVLVLKKLVAVRFAK